MKEVFAEEGEDFEESEEGGAAGGVELICAAANPIAAAKPGADKPAATTSGTAKRTAKCVADAAQPGAAPKRKRTDEVGIDPNIFEPVSDGEEEAAEEEDAEVEVQRIKEYFAGLLLEVREREKVLEKKEQDALAGKLPESQRQIKEYYARELLGVRNHEKYLVQKSEQELAKKRKTSQQKRKRDDGAAAAVKW